MTAPSETTSRGLIRSMIVTGAAQSANILISIGRMKVLALLLGPAGVGILSILTSLKDMGSQAAGLGMGSSGVREVALASDDNENLSKVRKVLFLANIVQGGLALLLVWLLREPLAIWLLNDATRATEVGLVGVAILLSLVAAAQTALLQGLRRIKELGLATVIAAVIATIVGLAAVWWLGEAGLIWFLLAQAVTSVVITAYFTRRLSVPVGTRLTAQEVWQVWKPLARLGLAFMLGGLASTATLLLVRAQITQELGLVSAGHFAAAWSITMIYIGFLLNAMAMDYYPRLTNVITDQRATVELINDQMQLGLALGGPVLLLLIGWAPWIIPALYSDEFGPAIALVQWQTLGNLFKIASWPLGFTNVAAGRSKIFFAFQIVFNLMFLIMLLPTLETVGIIAAGPAFALAYAIGFVLSLMVVRRYHDFRWQPLSLALLALHATLAVALLGAAQMAPTAVAVVALILAAATGVGGLRVVLIKVGPNGRLASRMGQFFSAIGWPLPQAD